MASKKKPARKAAKPVMAWIVVMPNGNITGGTHWTRDDAYWFALDKGDGTVRRVEVRR